MSFVIAVPDVVQGAAHDLAGIRASLTQAAATAGATTGIAASAGDEVSIADRFNIRQRRPAISNCQRSSTGIPRRVRKPVECRCGGICQRRGC